MTDENYIRADSRWHAAGAWVYGPDGDAVCECHFNPVLGGGDNWPVEAEERAERIARLPLLEALVLLLWDELGWRGRYYGDRDLSAVVRQVFPFLPASALDGVPADWCEWAEAEARRYEEAGDDR